MNKEKEIKELLEIAKGKSYLIENTMYYIAGETFPDRGNVIAGLAITQDALIKYFIDILESEELVNIYPRCRIEWKNTGETIDWQRPTHILEVDANAGLFTDGKLYWSEKHQMFKIKNTLEKIEDGQPSKMKQLREQTGKTQQQVATEANISLKTYQRLEGYVYPFSRSNYVTIKGIADALGVTIVELSEDLE